MIEIYRSISNFVKEHAIDIDNIIFIRCYFDNYSREVIDIVVNDEYFNNKYGKIYDCRYMSKTRIASIKSEFQFCGQYKDSIDLSTFKKYMLLL